MTVATTRMGLEEFFAYTSNLDTLYELEDGEVIEMPPESDLNQRITSFLFAYFLQQGVSPDRLRTKTEIAVMGERTTVRVPDLMVLSEELAMALEGANRATVTLDMPPPRLVVEVVSPGKKNIDRDYRYKRSQYEARGIAEYWIVDPIAQRITVLTRFEGLYEAVLVERNAAITSALLIELASENRLTAAQILKARY
ncbi:MULTISPECIES: Uma2 family endonuclease [Cyanophyceae]|uniref:Uma2 family endonuclease n=1 Tax=Leptolyngbya subtilissima DQ-A4 TaxID=2933933 RepID=A0ABV0KBH1_9CYAN|nr:Uma2 family endonuclease [Nodosilinea sp. FACHB-141]MBD2115146.1 Uma2 family endonuclease [Nodosilinea sp. FACHB-141]